MSARAGAKNRFCKRIVMRETGRSREFPGARKKT
jgi:hypothetical protein